MKIEWTTIESGKNKTNSKINTILENKNKISVFLAENKKHLFGAGMSTMAMAFVVGFANISGTEFSADVMFPSLTSEIEDISSAEGEIVNEEDLSFDDNSKSGNEGVSEDLDLSLEDLEIKTETGAENLFEPESDKASSEGVPEDFEKSNSDNTEELINDLFGLESDKNLEVSKEDSKTKTLTLLNEDSNEEKIGKKEVEKSEDENLSQFLESEKVSEEKTNIEEKFHGSAEKKSEPVKEENKNIFKENTHTVDMNLVSYNSNLEEEEDLHGSMESFLDSDEVVGIGSGVGSSEPVGGNYVQNSEPEVEYVVQKTQRLSQSGPGEMAFGLGFLSMILAFFLRRRKI